MFNVNAIRTQFPILDTQVYGNKLVYLDSAATSQKPNVVIDKVNDLHRKTNANIHRGIHFLAEQTTMEYENAREIVRSHINAQSVTEIVFTSGATAAINLVAHSFGESFKNGDNVVVSRMEHHSNIVPWQMLAQRNGIEIRVLEFDTEGRLEIEKLGELIDDRTKIVAITQTSNVLGTNNDIKKIAQLVHDKGSVILIDGCQGIVHNVIDVVDSDVDFYAFSGHKIYAPTGIGVLYGKEILLENMPPFLGGGDMISRVSFEKGTTWALLPLKFEAGTSNFTAAIALGTALQFVSKFDFAEVENHVERLAGQFTKKLVSNVEGVIIYGQTQHKAPIVSFNIDHAHPMDVAQIADKMGVALRSGTHCAEPVMDFYGVRAMVRASFAMYNNIEDVDVAVAAIKRAADMLR